MPVMKQKLIADFFEAVAVDRAITKNEISLEDGILILEDMIKYVRDDIKTLDESGYNELVEKGKNLSALNTQRKNKIKENQKPEDSIDERNFKRKLLKEDHNRFKRELVHIQDICYKKGWFD